VSGQINDFEERVVGLGLPFGLKRLAITVHPFAQVLQLETIEDDVDITPDNGGANSLLTGLIYYVVSHVFILHSIVELLSFHQIYTIAEVASLGLVQPSLLKAIGELSRVLFLVWAAPNMVRNMCLLLMTTSCHYYGDIPKNHLYYQNQILQHPLLWPFQIFCFNFAATHIIHHYVPNQPFYIRQMIADPVHKEMINNGVRKNDFGVIFRSNSYKRDESKATQEILTYFVFALMCVILGSIVALVYNYILVYLSLKIVLLPQMGIKIGSS
jgi:hypothetical protein